MLFLHRSIHHNVLVRHLTNKFSKVVYIQVPSQNMFCAAFIYFLNTLYLYQLWEVTKILYIKPEYLLKIVEVSSKG